MRTEHAKGNAEGDFSQATGSGERAALRQLQLVRDILADSKAEDIVAIDIAGKSALGDHMVVASGRSNRHVASICDRLITELKTAGFGNPRVEGLSTGDWVLIDANDVIIHVFRPEIREFYNLEKMWQTPELADEKLH
ncbi:ribosome silencing factor [Hoeflea sp. J2-29]|uniref:Ribosomal silencing factor RsfS n=1 Tax=Hoeflea ulvae TaxID=2983764 RepID=A0ABT3Y9Q9_9HYPH|nr:ribosome silencing factor [Hoeflea ulvae]MCY0092613.1 ribosome silencing factor [Hoeflea ulvae]